MSETTSDTNLEMAIIAAARNLHPDKPEVLSSKSLIPYFKECGMDEQCIVPSGLREYVTEVLNILDLPPTLDNTTTVLERPEVKATLRSALSAASNVHQRQNESGVKPNIPGVSEEAITQLSEIAEAETAQKNALSFSQALEQSAKKVAKEKQEQTPEPLSLKSSVTESDTQPVYCPRCGWKVNQKYSPAQVTDDDRVLFAFSIMNRTPFQKTFGLFNEQLKITFRSKTTTDDKLILEQLRKDLKEELYIDSSSITLHSNLYELSLLLVEITGEAVDPVKSVEKPNLSDYSESPNALREYSNALLENYIGTEALLRLISEHYRVFTQTYKALVDEALQENFYAPA